MTYVGEEGHFGLVGLLKLACQGEQLVALFLKGGTLTCETFAGAATGAVEEIERQHEA